MNIVKSFSDFLETEGFGTLGVDIYLGGVPQGAPDSSIWLMSGGGSPVLRTKTNEMVKQYLISIFMRSLDPEELYDDIQALEELINAEACPSLTGYEVVEMRATSFPTDNDLDNVERTIGLIQVTLTTYL